MVEGKTNIPEVDCSLANLFDKSTLYSAILPASAYVDIIKEAGYRGLEWWPFRAVGNKQMEMGLVSQDTKNAVLSLHQSFRGERSFKEAWRSPKRFISLASYIFLPERVASLNNLERLQTVIGRELPIVLYPGKDAEESGNNRKFYSTCFQPTSEVMERWNVRNVLSLATEAQLALYGRPEDKVFCVDLAHLRARALGQNAEYTLNPWQETLPELLNYTQEIHISVGRLDMPYDYTRSELKDLLKGTQETEIVAMLKLIKWCGWKGRIVTEIPAIALHDLHDNSRFLPISTLIQDHKEIVNNIKSWMS